MMTEMFKNYLLSGLNESSSGGDNDLESFMAASLNQTRLNSSPIAYFSLMMHKSTTQLSLSDHVYLFIYVAIFIVGLIGNFLVIYFVLFYKRMQTMTNKLITNLSIADLLVIFFCVPVTASRHVVGSDVWLFGELVCKASGFVQGVALSVSVMTLTAISIDRYFIIHKPMKVKSICTNRKVKLIVAGIWLLSMFIMSPLLVVFKFDQQVILTDTVRKTFVVYTICFEKWPLYEAKLIYGVLLLLVLFIVPIIFMSYAYFIVGKELWFVKKNLGFDQVLNDAAAFNHHHQQNDHPSITNHQISTHNSSKGWRRPPVPKKKDTIGNNTPSQHEYSLIEVSSGKANAGHQVAIEPEAGEPSSCNAKNIICCFRQKKFSNNGGGGGLDSAQHEALNSLLHQVKLQKSDSSRRMLNQRRAASAEIDKNGGSKNTRNVEAINNLIESRRRVVRLSIVLVLLFLFSWLPYHIISLTIDVLFYREQSAAAASGSSSLSNRTTSEFVSKYIYPVALCFALANSVTNPVCYISLSHGFRNMFKSSFHRFFNCNI